VSMPWAVTPGALVALDVHSSPDRTERRESADILAEQAARGVHYAVQVATDSVSVGRTSQQEPFIYSQLGSRSSGIGTPMAWPWAASRNRPAYGATDSDGLSAEDLLAVMSRRGNRMLVVTPDWIDAAGPPVGWFPAPDMLRIEGLDDLDTVFTVYDAWLPLSLVGPLTWVDSVDPREPFESVDIAAGLIDGQTTATSGPRLHLSVGDAQIGDVASVQAPFRATVRVEAPTWIPLTGAALYSTGGETLATWDLRDADEALRLEDTIEISEDPTWIILVAWGEEPAPPWQEAPAWAVSSPVWLSRP